MNLKMQDDALFNLRWDAQRSALLGSVATLFREEAFVDTTVVSDGQIFKAHKLLLSASSTYLKEILESVPSQHAVLFMPHINSSDLGNVLKFIYEGEVKINRRALKSFLAAAKLLKIKGMDFDLDEDLDSSISSVPHSAQPQSANFLSSTPLKRAATIPPSSSGNSGISNLPEDEVNNIPPHKKSSSASLKQEHRNNVQSSLDLSVNESAESRNSVDGKSRNSTGESPNKGNSSANPLPEQTVQNKASSNTSRSENSRHGSGTSSVSDSEMGIMEDSNHSSNAEALPLVTIPEHLMDSAADLDSRQGDDDHNDQDPNMENEMDNDYDDDDDQNFSMSMQPEVSIRESDESYSILDRHQSHRLKTVQSMNSFNLPSHGNSGLTVSAASGSSSSSPFNSQGLSLRNIHKLRPLVPKSSQSVHLPGQTSQAQAISDGILMRMMREPLHSSKSGSATSTALANFFDMGHGDTNHAGGLRKQKRYVQCTSCSKVLSSLSALKRHMEDVHCARIQGKCIICGRVYSSRNSLLTHVYSAHKKHHDYKAVARIIRESDFEQFATA